MGARIFRRFLPVAVVAGVLLAASVARAQTLDQLNQDLSGVAPQVAEGVTDEAAASEAIEKLDHHEAIFARLAESSQTDREALLGVYARLEEMLNRMYTTYKKKKDDCIALIEHGGQCDYNAPEQLELRALYPLSWLRFEGALLYGNRPSTARRLLNEAIDGFTDSTLVLFAPELIRENLLGRAYSERELGRFDRSEYAKAVADFRQIMKAGPGTRQYRAAEQGLATTYGAMGKLDEAQKLMGDLASGASGPQTEGLQMLRLRELFKAEALATDPAKRAEYHREAVRFMREREADRTSWEVVVAAVAQYVRDPIAEFGDSSDPFESYLLASVLYSEHRQLAAAKYYWKAAESGKYPGAYKYAADIYYSQGRLDIVERLLDEIVREPGNPDAQWASYMRFKIPRTQWERGGTKDARLQDKWMAAARSYLKTYPHGRYAYEPRFRLGEAMQGKGQYLEAVEQYEQVIGSPDYDYTARFNAAQCEYKALVAMMKSAGKSDASKLPADREALRKATVEHLRTAINTEPQTERKAPASQRAFLRDTRGRAVYMLASLLEHQPKINQQEVASLLAGYESQYPSMSKHFQEIFGWRVQALDELGQYEELQREVQALRERNRDSLSSSDFIKEIGYGFWKSAEQRQAQADRNAYLGNVRLTALTYGYFEDMVQKGRIPAKDLTGTLSILAQAYAAMDEEGKAAAIFTQVVRADPASPDANAGLARIAQARKNYGDAVNLWTRVESVAAESDNLWYEAKYNIAEIYAAEGNISAACNKLAATRSEHPSLGTPEMKAQWNALQRKLCLDNKES